MPLGGVINAHTRNRTKPMKIMFKSIKVILKTIEIVLEPIQRIKNKKSKYGRQFSKEAIKIEIRTWRGKCLGQNAPEKPQQPSYIVFLFFWISR